MGSKGGPSASTTATEQKISSEQVALAEKQDERATRLFDLTEPGLETAIKHYTTLSKGDPAALFHEIAPAAQGASQKFDQSKRNIDESMPRGGEKNLAMEEAEISKAGTVGNMVNQAYEGSFASLANLAGKGIGLSANQVANAIAAFGGASNTTANLANQEAEGKMATMGMLASFGGSAAEMAAGL